MHVQADIMMCSSCPNSMSQGGSGDDDDNDENAKETQYTKKRCNKKWVRKCSSLKSSSQL